MHARELHHFEEEQRSARLEAAIREVLNLVGDPGPEARRILTSVLEQEGRTDD
jgi:hypothetical protein